MHPKLFVIEVFGREIPYYSYGAMLAVAFLVGISLAVLNGRQHGVAKERIVNLSFLIVLCSIFGSRVLHVLMAEDTGELGVFSADSGGFAFYGGLVGAFAVGAWYTRKHKIPFLFLADVMIPSVAIGQFFGRLGCFCAGCCWGKPLDTPASDFLLGFVDFTWPQSLALRFMNPEALAPKGVHLVPTQLLMSFSNLLVFVILWFVVRPRRRFTGQVLAGYLILYPFFRSTWEFFRADPRGHYFGETLTSAQLVSIPMIACGLYLLWRGKTGKARPAERLGSASGT